MKNYKYYINLIVFWLGIVFWLWGMYLYISDPFKKGVKLPMKICLLIAIVNLFSIFNIKLRFPLMLALSILFVLNYFWR